ncbi:MAG: hypothetical protein WCK09_00290 [Bacteroidota bacterium]
MTIQKNSNLIPSVCKISVVPVSEVSYLGNTTDRFHKSIDFSGSIGWTGIYFTPGTAEFVEKPKDTDAGDLLEQSLKFIFPGEDDANVSALDALVGPPVLVKIEYTTGAAKIMGDMVNGAKLSLTNQVASKGAGYQFEFTCSATYRACWLDA